MNEIEDTISKLSHEINISTCPLVQRKCAVAISNLKRARTLLENSELTLAWAKQYVAAAE